MTSSEAHAARLWEAFRAAHRSLDLPGRTRHAFRGAPSPGAILAVGKSAGAMVDGALGAASAPAVAILPDGYPAPTAPGVRVLRVAHPLPDARCAAAVDLALELARASTPAAPLWLCLSGGGSACLGDPLPPAGEDALADLTRGLMASGAGIRELNGVRAHLCRALGGRLGAAARGLVAAVAVDIADQDVALVASGPAHAWTEGRAAAVALLQRTGRADWLPRLVDPPPCPAWPHTAVLTPSDWRAALAGALPGCTVEPRALVDPDGVAAWVDRALLAGGTSVAVGEVPFTIPPGAPPGGRAAHLALWVARRLQDTGRAFALVAAGSDGRDGPTQCAGARVTDAALAGVSTGELDAALAAGAAHRVLGPVGALLPRFSSALNVLDGYLLWLAPAGGAR